MVPWVAGDASSSLAVSTMSEEEKEQEETQEEERKFPEEVVRMSKEDMAKFIREFRSGQIFSSAHLPEHDDRLIPMVFLVLTLGALYGAPDSYINSIGLIWEYLKQAGPRSINGYPQFFSCRLVHKEDWEKIRKTIIELDNREKSDVESLLDSDGQDSEPSNS